MAYLRQSLTRRPINTITQSANRLPPKDRYEKYKILLPDGKYESEWDLKCRLDEDDPQPVHPCDCDITVNEEIEGPYYTHLAAAKSVEDMYSLLQERSGFKRENIRIEKVQFTQDSKVKIKNGCPKAKWILRRSGWKEKILCLVRERPDHKCFTSVIAVSMVIWKGVKRMKANRLYENLVGILAESDTQKERRCAKDKPRKCICQGKNLKRAGASFSFGCTWSTYTDGCKFKSLNPRKFKLQPKESKFETDLGLEFNNLADEFSPMLKKMAPACYYNMTYYGDRAQSCRLGTMSDGPFSGVTACLDFSAHPHQDIRNMNNGCTVVVSLIKHRGWKKSKKQQYHVLPFYGLDTKGKHIKGIQNVLSTNVGGVGLALTHGSVLLEVAKREFHATTSVRNPNRFAPTRIGLVFYQHGKLLKTNHSFDNHQAAMELKKEKADHIQVDGTRKRKHD